MIVRQWKAIARTQNVTDYINHLETETFPQLSRIHGFVRASILTRPVDRGVEFLIVTVWESMEAIQEFAGLPAQRAVVPVQVQAMMIDYDREVSHYEVTADYIP
jgi:heme-degrading monooxygenase HmoA